MLTAAMRGELGPLAQAVARYQVERRIRNEMEKLQAIQDELKNIQASKGSDVSQDVSLYSEYRETRDIDSSVSIELQRRSDRSFSERFHRLVDKVERGDVANAGQGSIELDFRRRRSDAAEERSEGKDQARRKADGKVERTDQIVRVAKCK